MRLGTKFSRILPVLPNILFTLLVLYTLPLNAGTNLRFLTGNLSAGRFQSYDTGEGIRIFQALKPDVAAVQEFKFGDNSPAAIRSFVDQSFGPHFQYYREFNQSNQLPNGIVSRFPILEAGRIQDPGINFRGAAWVKIQTPDGKVLWVYSIHLSSQHADKRDDMADLIIDHIDKNAAIGDRVIVAGDLNVNGPNGNTIQIFSKKLSAQKRPVGFGGVFGTDASGRKALDWILPNIEMEKHQVCTTFFRAIGGSKDALFPNGFIFDSTKFPNMNLVQPARVNDSAGEKMQHNAVIKDFVLP